MSSKKRLSWELVIFGITFVAAGFFVYLQQKNISITEVWDMAVTEVWHRTAKQAEQNVIQKMDVIKEKSITEENYQNFQRNNILDGLLNSDKYKQLQGTEVIINTEEGVGNPEPFNKPKVEIKP